MKYKSACFIALMALMSFVSCRAEKNNYRAVSVGPDEKVVLFETTMGDFKVKLYNDTPLHRDNFIKIIKDGIYDGIIFHRVVKNFVIQAGDPNAHNVPQGEATGEGDVSWTVPAEIKFPEHFHKHGALAMAREDISKNPLRESSGAQFYIVTGQKYTQAQLERREMEANDALQREYFDSIFAQHKDEIQAMRSKKDSKGLLALQDEMESQARQYVKEHPAFTLTPEILKEYTSLGGIAHLDNEYTVFGEVIEGMDVVVSISMVRTDRRSRPFDDVVIKKVTVL